MQLVLSMILLFAGIAFCHFLDGLINLSILIIVIVIFIIFLLIILPHFLLSDIYFSTLFLLYHINLNSNC